MKRAASTAALNAAHKCRFVFPRYAENLEGMYLFIINITISGAARRPSRCCPRVKALRRTAGACCRQTGSDWLSAAFSCRK